MEPYVGYRRKKRVYGPRRANVSVTVFWATCDCCKRKGAINPGWVIEYNGLKPIKATCHVCAKNDPGSARAGD